MSKRLEKAHSKAGFPIAPKVNFSRWACGKISRAFGTMFNFAAEFNFPTVNVKNMCGFGTMAAMGRFFFVIVYRETRAGQWENKAQNAPQNRRDKDGA